MRDFMLGCNYWDSKSGTDMWRNFSEDTIRADLQALSACGVRYMRVFPNWRDFQPVEEMYGWGGGNHGCCDYADQELQSVEGVDPEQIAHFRTFVNLCAEYDIKLIVSVVTGWMSGRLFMPHALFGKNLITDSDALMWTCRFIRGFVNGVKDLPNIVMWDLGNECNCMGQVDKRSQAYLWTALVRNTITACDPTRKVSSGMHALASDNGKWTIKDQGELTDYLTPHPYVSRTIHNDIDPMNRTRTTMLPTAQCMFYSDIGGKPAILQEQGTFSEALGNQEQAADFVRINILSCLAHNVKGYLWWCGMNHSALKQAPYSWSMLERELGMLENDRTPKKVGQVIREMSELMDRLPFEQMPERERDAVCLLTTEQYQWDSAAPAFVLGKQAGVEMTFAVNEDPLPDAPLYIVPCLTGWSVMDKRTQDALFEHVSNGSDAYISFDGGQFNHFEEFFGLKPNGIVSTGKTHRAAFPWGSVEYAVKKEVLVENADAEVLAVNEEGNVVFARHTYGKGTVYFLNLPLEQNCANTYGAYQSDWYRVYQMAARSVLEKKPMISENANISLIFHPENENRMIVSALNYMDRAEKCAYRLQEGWKMTVLEGSAEEIGKCSGAFYLLEKV